MKRFTIFVAIVAGALSLAAVSLADPGDNGKQKQGHAKFTFTMTTTDNGCTGNPWATDTETRTYSVRDNGDGDCAATPSLGGSVLCKIAWAHAGAAVAIRNSPASAGTTQSRARRPALMCRSHYGARGRSCGAGRSPG